MVCNLGFKETHCPCNCKPGGAVKSAITQDWASKNGCFIYLWFLLEVASKLRAVCSCPAAADHQATNLLLEDLRCGDAATGRKTLTRGHVEGAQLGGGISKRSSSRGAVDRRVGRLERLKDELRMEQLKDEVKRDRHGSYTERQRALCSQ